MNFKKDGNNIKLDSITDDGKALDITKYSEPLLSIGADGKYTRTSIEPSDTKEPSNNEVISITQTENVDTTGTWKESGDLTTQEAETPNNEENNPNNANPLDQACKDLELESGCEKQNTDPTYKTKYKVLARKYHPDKCLQNNLPQEECKSNESKFKIINEAYSKLNNYNVENSESRVSENNEPTNKPVNTKTPAIENSKPIVSSVFSFPNNLQENKSELPTNIRVPPENNSQQIAIRTGGKTKRRKAGKKNKSKRVRFMSRRNRRR
jgi:hypothetical protein